MDAFEEYLKSYSVLFESTGALTVLVFGGASFILLRNAGIIRDDDIRRFSFNWLLIGAAALCLINQVSGFLGSMQIMDFFDDRSQGTIKSGCTTRATTEVQIFIDCYRSPLLQTFVLVNLFSSILAAGSSFIWLTLQLGGKK